MQGIERQDKADRAEHAGEDDAGIVKLEHDAVDSRKQQDIGDVGVGDDGQQFGAPIGGNVAHYGALGRDLGLSRGQLDHPPVRLGEQIGQIIGDEVDDIGLERLLRG